MKYSSAVVSVFSLSNLSVITGTNECAPDALEFHDNISMKIERVGSVPALATDPFSYNMAVMDNFEGDTIYFLDQQFGKIYSYDHETSSTSTVFDIDSSKIPKGLTFDWQYGVAASTFKVKAMTQGSKSNEIYIVFTSSTLPKGWTKPDAKLPPPGAYSQYACGPDDPTFIRDIYRPGVLPECTDNYAGVKTFVAYDVFYKYSVVNGNLRHPKPFFVSETPVLPGHMGGGIVSVDNGKILYSTGDCTVFGVDGSYPPQLDFETCGKILLINPKNTGKFSIVAKGVRNSQQMRIFSKTDRIPKADWNATEYLVFMDIGGVTAEEVNARPLHKILDKNTIDNFGWGRSLVDGRAREGTFYVEPGNMLVLGGNPKCASSAPMNEPGFIKPWIQFGRTETDFYYAISSFAVPYKAVNKIQLLWSEFNTGNLLATDEKIIRPGKTDGSPATGYKIKIYNAAGVLLENSLNDLVKEELGEVGFYRGDPRLFHYPDGQAGVFIERTGVFYKLSEIP